MFGRKPQTPSDTPNLLERAFAAGCTRLAVISLHPGAGARTLLQHSAMEFHRRGVALGVTRAPRLPLEAISREGITPIHLPEGTIVATVSNHDEGDVLEPLGRPISKTALGDIALFRMTREADVRLYGPDDVKAMPQVLQRLDEQSGGLALVDGAWERRAFAAPGGAQAVVLVAGSGYSGNPERSAAALTYTIEQLELQRAAAAVLRAWPAASERGTTTMLDPDGECSRILPDRGEELAASLARRADETSVVLLPGGLHDDMLGPLTRSSVRCTLVVRDPTCLRIAPIYFRAWNKGGGAIRVVEPMQVLAVATNPVNLSGPDADPGEFRQLVSDTLPGLPIHDVVLEAQTVRPGRWGFLPGR